MTDMAATTNRWTAPQLPQRRPQAPRRVRRVSQGAPSASEEAFSHLGELLARRYGQSRSRSFRALCAALEEAEAEICATRGVSDAQARRLKEWLLRDLARMAAVLARSPAVSSAATRLAAAREAGMPQQLARVLGLCGDAVYRLAGESRATHLATGDITCAGTLVCVGCGRRTPCRGVVLVEQCRQCRADSFTKTF
jgi:hypothetical protein